jgi:hypothetical protein
MENLPKHGPDEFDQPGYEGQQDNCHFQPGWAVGLSRHDCLQQLGVESLVRPFYLELSAIITAEALEPRAAYWKTARLGTFCPTLQSGRITAKRGRPSLALPSCLQPMKNINVRL